ncbi:MAG TPA: efflux RND transporter periplasmic adaptor subunit [Kofleriaceae bacterium]|jgi:RND family efflux transporter MFP subunit|nr:efflux RND transporter periplasmic adaptor subunit [Kofleriaceae bacterium]
MSTPGDSDDLGFPLPPPARASRVGVFVVVGLVVGGAFAFGYLRKQEARSEISAPEAGVRRVEVIAPKAIASDRPLALPGTVRALEETQLYARVTGYVKAWHVDLGDKVKAGQLLAEIDAPELASQLSQARAQLASARAAVKQATAQRDFSQSNSSRYSALADQKLVARAQVEETEARAKTDEASLSSAESNVAAQEANVRRLSELQAYTRVVAPFAGTVTQRAIERGALVREGSTGAPLFTIVATDPVRVFVDVPQSIAMHVRPGAEATISVRELGARPFAGKVTRVAGALDPQLHTMTTEIQIPNSDAALLPGMYVQAQLMFSVPHRVLEIPATALYNDANGTRVATVDEGGRAHYVKIEIERDTGATLQVAAGLTGTERVLKIAVPALAEGEPLEVAPPPAAPKAAANK